MPRLNAIKIVLLIAAVLLLSTAHPLMAAPKVFTIQVSAHRTAAEAAARVSDLAAQGIEAYSSEERVSGQGRWYRVYIGRYASRAEALGHARDLKNSRRITDFWVKTTTSLPGESMPVMAMSEPQAPIVHPMPMSHPAPMPAALENEPADTLYSDAEPRLGVIDAEVSGVILPPLQRDSDIPVNSMNTEAAALTGGGSTNAGTGQQEPEVVRFGQPREAPLEAFTPYGPNDYVRGPLYLGLRMGVEQWLAADDFTISKTVGIHTTYYRVDKERAAFLALTPGYRLNEYLAIEGMVERTWATDIHGWTGGLGLKAGTTLPNNFYVYGKLNGLYGSLTWDDVPGKFKNDLGYELAVGLDMNLNRFKLGFELGYRNLEFEYEAPNGGAIYGGDSDLDLSSVRLSTSLSYAF